MEQESEWDEGVHLLLYAVRSSYQESLGFTPFELIFGHEVRGPLKVMKECWINDEKEESLYQYVQSFKNRLKRVCEIARDNLTKEQERMKEGYDLKTEHREFSPGDNVLVFLPVHKAPLQSKFCGPFKVKRKVSDLNYVIETPSRRKKERLVRVNLLKPYYARNYPDLCLSQGTEPEAKENCDGKLESESSEVSLNTEVKVRNSVVLSNLDGKLSHLSEEQRNQVCSLIHSFAQ